MKLVLDTHVVLWWLDDDPRLSASTRRLLADDGNQLCSSIASLWEIAIKHGLGRLSPSAALVASWLGKMGIETLPVTLSHLNAVETLPLLHRDPFDRLIVAQAMVESATLMTSDRALQLYAIPQIAA